MSAILSVLALFACAPHPGTATRGPTSEASILAPVLRVPLPDLRDVACAPDGCLALTAGTLVRLDAGLVRVALTGDWDTLRWSGTAFLVEGPCGDARCAAVLGADLAPGATTPASSPTLALDDEPPPLADLARAWEGWWNLGIARGWRSGFRRVLIGPGGGLVTWSRGGEGVGQLVRVSAPRLFVRVPVPTSPVSWPAWLALHPTGVEAYLMVWPSTKLLAVDPVSLDTRWTAPLEGAGAGLFIDPGGRWLLAEEGPGKSDRWVDWPTPTLDPAPPDDPFRDEALRGLPRPTADAVVVVDLAAKGVVARAEGRFRRFLARGDGWILATDREIIRTLP